LFAVIVASLILAVSSARAENLADCAKGAASLEAGNRDAAIDELTRCIELGGLSDRNLAAASNNPNTLDSRAFAYWLLEEHEKARKDLDQAREIDSSHLTWQERFHEFEEIILGRFPGE
jgi:tetratricopeptide (TPR) repeat protein